MIYHKQTKVREFGGGAGVTVVHTAATHANDVAGAAALAFTAWLQEMQISATNVSRGTLIHAGEPTRSGKVKSIYKFTFTEK